ncbi:unnamed protein product, partial [Choristocarpus tenellus]
ALDVENAGVVGYLRRVASKPVMDADLTLPSPGSEGSLSAAMAALVLDTSVPYVTTINSTLVDGTYGVGQNIPVLVTFSGRVGVNSTHDGLPYILLNSGGHAVYTGGNSSSQLAFLYVVGDGDESQHLDIDVYAEDVTQTTTIQLNQSVVFDLATGASAVVTLPKPGTYGSLGENEDIIVDTK